MELFNIDDILQSNMSMFDLIKAANQYAGLLEAGNIDLTKRPRVKMPDGSIATVRSMGVNIGGQEILIPTISDDGRLLTDDEAVALYRETGKHLGKFSSVDAANKYAEKLHRDQEKMYVGTER